ncbi:MAG: zinc-ribbon and DUF3426 domain-containing protein [Caldimonas sp.]
MSLATRCTSCGTAFRVVQDQLKISEGWVRCGRCDAVFNALEGLFDLGRDAPAEWEEPGTAPLPAIDESASDFALPARWGDNEGGGESGDSVSTALDELLDPIDAHLFGPKKRTENARKHAVKVEARDRLEFSDARFDSDLFAENTSAADAGVIEAPVTDAAALPLESSMRPEFVRRAERRARWRSTPVRTALGSACAIAAIALVLQAGHHFRDSVAAQWPSTRPALLAWCRLAKCTLDAPRRILDVFVENTALTRAIGLDASVLSVNLRSHSSLALTLPWIDLTLTDGNGGLVASRVLSPRDFRSSELLPAGAEAALQVTLSTGTARVAGYTVEIFYP